jgi:spore coat-associated protein N
MQGTNRSSIRGGFPQARLLKTSLLAILALAAVAVITMSISGALFTDSDPVGTNVFDSGTVILTTAPTSAIWAAVNTGAPGDRATGSLTATNGGSLSLRYAISGGNTSSTLAAGMNLRIALRGGASCDFPYHNTDGTTTSLTDDTQLYAGSLNTAALVGSNAQGSQAGDRTLAAAASEVLCFGVVLPTTAGNTLQGLNDTATFTFDSEQTANNP